MKADIQILVSEYLALNGWFGPESSQSPDMMLTGCL